MLTVSLLAALLVGALFGAVLMAAIAAGHEPDVELFPEAEIDRLTPKQLLEAIRTKSPVVAMADLWPEAPEAIDDAPIMRRRSTVLDAPIPAA